MPLPLVSVLLIASICASILNQALAAAILLGLAALIEVLLFLYIGSQSDDGIS